MNANQTSLVETGQRRFMRFDSEWVDSVLSSENGGATFEVFLEYSFLSSAQDLGECCWRNFEGFRELA